MSEVCTNCSYLDLESARFDAWGNRMYRCGYDGSWHYYDDRACSHYSVGSSSSCYLTSACVGYLGKPDDCYELTTLREFRDNYLKKTEEGQTLVNQYYEVAPKIVEKIEASGKQKEYYEYIYGVVNECVTCIEKGDKDGALSRYREMTLKLKNELLEN